jgi:hypothetical protein
MREQKKYYKTTLERIKKDYYGVVMDFAICKCICRFSHQNNGQIPKERVDNFTQEFDLLDPRARVS